jgi:hypothetical protein
MTAALAAPFSVRKGNDEVSTARERLDLDVVHGFLAASYWAAGIPRATVERALAASLNFGLYRDGAQIGFARFGFEPLARPERFMEILAPDVYARPGG